MSCAYRIFSSSAVIPAPARAGTDRPGFLKAIIGAFQEAVEMRHAAQRSCFLGDE